MGRWGFAIVAAVLGLGAVLWMVATEPAVEDEPGTELRLTRGGDPVAGAREPGATDSGGAQPESLDLNSPANAKEVADAAHWPDGIEAMTVTGRVLNADAEPISDADVFLFPDRRTGNELGLGGSRPYLWWTDVPSDQLVRTCTDDAGRFELTGPWLPDGGHRQPAASSIVFPSVIVRARGFTLVERVCLGFSGGRHALGDLVLEVEAARLHVRFVDPSGEPLSGVGAHRSGEFALQDSRRSDPASERGVGATSDAQGLLHLNHLRPRRSFQSFSFEGATSERFEVDLVAGETTDLGTVVISPDDAPSITGVVRDTRGLPIAGARVHSKGVGWSWADDLEEVDGVDELAKFAGSDQVGGVVTDADGTFVLRDLYAGADTHDVVATARGFEPAVFRELAADGVPLAITLSPAARLRVRVHAATDGRELATATLQAFRLANRWSRLQSGREGIPLGASLEVIGTTVMGVGPRGTMLVVSADGFAPKAVTVPGIALGQVREVRVELEPAFVFSLRVVDDRGLAVEHAALTLLPPVTWSSGAEDPESGMRVTGVTDASGRWSHVGLAAGTWRLKIEAPGHVSLVTTDVSVTSEDSEQQFELTRAATISGTLLELDGSPVVAGIVSFSGRAGKLYLPNGSALTDLNGAFTLPALAPVTWRNATKHTSEHEFTLAPGDHAHVELRRQPPCVVTGRVVSAAGAPVESARLNAYLVRPDGSTGFWQRNHASWTDADGRFEIELPFEGTARVELSKDRVWQPSFEVESRFGERVQRDVTLGTGSISGTILFEHLGLEYDDVDFGLLRDGALVASTSLTSPGSDGRFHLQWLTPGQYQLRIYSRDTHQGEWVGPFEIASGESIEGVEIELRAAASLRVIARWEDGSPYTGHIHLRDLETRGDYELSSEYEAGDATFEGLAPGRWKIDLADIDAKALGAGVDGVAGVGEPGTDLPFFAREFVTIEANVLTIRRITIPGAPAK